MTADVVIIGGGVMGASVAYHLASRGMRKVVLLEKEQFFGQGATGRQGSIRGSLQQYGAECPGLILEQTGRPVRQVGSQGIGTDKLGQILGLVCACLQYGPHLIK